MKEMM